MRERVRREPEREKKNTQLHLGFAIVPRTILYTASESISPPALPDAKRQREVTGALREPTNNKGVKENEPCLPSSALHPTSRGGGRGRGW